MAASKAGFVSVELLSDKNVQPTFHFLTTQLPPVSPTDASNDLFSKPEGVTLADISLQHAEIVVAFAILQVIPV